jgi:hypothetical protein
MKKSIIKNMFLLLILFVPTIMSAQTDSVSPQGTIRILKPKGGKVFIKAFADFGRMGVNNFQPFPVVEGYSFPFNYTRYFNEKFRDKRVFLNYKSADTVYLEVSISKKGKTTIKDITYSMSNGRRSFFDTDNKVEKNDLQVSCFRFLNEIEQWFPAYEMTTRVSSYKGQQVIKPVKKNKDATGIITIMFSLEPFDN